MEVRQKFQLGPLEDFQHVDIFQNYRACAVESCFTSEFGCSLELDMFQESSFTYEKTLEFGLIMSHNYCTRADLGIDGDIVGPGLFIAYLIQFSLSTFFVISLHLTMTWTKYLVWICLWPFHGVVEALTRARKWQRVLSSNRFAGAVASTIVDLQEAQSQYLAIISIVGVVAYFGGGYPGFGNAHTFRAWYTNNLFLHDIVSSSMFPILSVQIALHRTENRWWYTLLWVFFTWVMVLTIPFSGPRSREEVEKYFKSNAGLASCGQNAGPKTYCMNYAESDEGYTYNGLENETQISFSGRFTYWVIHGIMPFLLWDWFVKGVLPFFIPRKGITRHILYLVLSAGTGQPMLRFLELFTMILSIYNLVSFIIERKNVGSIYGGGDSDSVYGGWSSRQFVALFVWFPVVGKFVSILVGKSEASFLTWDIINAKGLDGTVQVAEKRANNYVNATLARGRDTTSSQASGYRRGGISLPPASR
ncbi:hypothetical protein NCS52_01411400 [Fusarium sp. LHS14.1]|nr:hypothetical protein NCS52_01411400 [Fusarium sp. LHS14.1]